ncbi:proprotein convertase subtilisin/kexin type 1 inhibitor, like [Thalassophryne amazonica]|uniref:proprotein convertase subtilisin/kexin type 1 inhibitor, like n=1 Tax=Thalassophryne amazonica TaxID=390379 RepID=UPI0014717CDA|nr:proprotein convertase subtilisin/kexin type 1 inhibitor, like [Thalassophryne amazonica]
MASLHLLLLSTALMHIAQSLPVDRGHGLDVSVGGARHQRRSLPSLVTYEENLMSYPTGQGGGVVIKPLYNPPEFWRGSGLQYEKFLRIQEEKQRAAYLKALLHSLSEAENAGLVNTRDVDEDEEEEDLEEDSDQRPPRDFQDTVPVDYDETGLARSMGRSRPTWWGLMEPQLAQALLDRLEPQLAQALLEKAWQERLQQSGRGLDQETLRHLVARLLSSLGPNEASVMPSGRRVRRDLSVLAGAATPEPVASIHRRTRRSLDDTNSPPPSNNPPLLRVKRLEEEERERGVEESYRSKPSAGLQRMKRIDAMVTAAEEEPNHGSRRRRRRAVLTYDPQILIDHILEYMRE